MNSYKVISNMFVEDSKRHIFCKHIDYMRFPFFKNYKENIQVNFGFPIVFLTGTNGTGKSSLLHALYGTVENNSISEFWFNTALDPIKDLENERHCFIYGYTTEFTHTNVEALKTRIQRKKRNTERFDPEYWEPSRPIMSYGMKKIPEDADEREASKTRWKLLKRKVYYMDFRYSLSAFDKYFYFGSSPVGKTIKSKQDLIRKRAIKIKTAFDYDSEQSFYTRIVDKPIKFSAETLKEISFILGKSYREAKFLHHNLYDGERGFAIRYKTDLQSYSEAYAGSGEVAVAKLVNDILGAEKYSMILLDEPETSLHPAAQKRLIEFLLKQIIDKKLQIVISTHSPDILQDAPNKSIKVMYESEVDGKIDVLEDVHYENAFLHIGHSLKEKKKIIVEDKLAKWITEKVLADIGDSEIFEVVYYPGGESRIKQEEMVVYSKSEEKNVYILFDGDQSFEKVKISELTEIQKKPENLTTLIYSVLNQKIEFSVDGSNKKNDKTKEKKDEQVTAAMLKYLKFIESNVFFLPKQIPEEIIWDDGVLELYGLVASEKKKITDEENYKKKINVLAGIVFGDRTAQGQEAVHKLLITRWAKKESKSYDSIVNIIQRLKNY